MSTDVRKFLERHEQASDRLNFDAVAESFADVLLSLHPNTTVTREQLLAALPARQRLSQIGGPCPSYPARTRRSYSVVPSAIVGEYSTVAASGGTRSRTSSGRS